MPSFVSHMHTNQTGVLKNAFEVSHRHTPELGVFKNPLETSQTQTVPSGFYKNPALVSQTQVPVFYSKTNLFWLSQTQTPFWSLQTVGPQAHSFPFMMRPNPQHPERQVFLARSRYEPAEQEDSHLSRFWARQAGWGWVAQSVTQVLESRDLKPIEQKSSHMSQFTLRDDAGLSAKQSGTHLVQSALIYEFVHCIVHQSATGCGINEFSSLQLVMQRFPSLDRYFPVLQSDLSMQPSLDVLRTHK
ncbi:Hypothetical_protein [Hexamita inflata]|uniref:Hypothetical_protein n=1 Tax=Hexamita inflata TaxID=28002 RepID=A0AA86RW82_9EUKA|nr:Hypothetical protein HINF_LOCUS61360 [Hexamita inflata]